MNHMIDGDNGSDCQSPLHDNRNCEHCNPQEKKCGECGNEFPIGAVFFYADYIEREVCGKCFDEMLIGIIDADGVQGLLETKGVLA